MYDPHGMIMTSTPRLRMHATAYEEASGRAIPTGR